MKTLRLFLPALIAAALALPAAAAEKIPLSEISAYLNSLKRAKGEFTQINADGSISTGTIYISRPNRARFEYDPPAHGLVVVGRGHVAVFDRKSNTAPEMFPLGRTPLSIILAERVDLADSRMVVRHTGDGTATTVVAQDPQHPEYGNIQLKFTDEPLALRQWVITNEAGDQTTVVLGEMQRGVRMAGSLFDVPDIGQQPGPTK
ncbi:cell envelope biogenesis protein LolA [Maritimibacter sp. 55A14]|uniref:LolA family protein n=1 Tax=Maritimibacter sp. 55A14 TaxID=2174844 RepID=UPI000D61D76B|nr:outer membrane lipoprotein carrier protein LolA [Maritimibacter sp. 55A14]PWE33510.1 cell envelope biogenesis protein LolA [Maritimibacter sp. 55A14]